ncbi:transglycosylase SLT domain-containing protein [Pseudothermotoga thermarum]|uniref:Lytic transglycosylase catalytic n=1 Tax=Pseudothermotoga thermarum DSM 5069 TaxID=688269 RepID=F7YX28_9THEM|nr:transglycosylase SLT domain-containing protein [Pseudothermotoga thermarum]AEH50674.1 Lytic transglycosylase catalytic [Pseudothermotoga thermarum DSM 5069]
MNKFNFLFIVFLTMLLCSIALSQVVPQWFQNLVQEARGKFGLVTDPKFVEELYTAILNVSEKHGLDPLLIVSLILVESEFRFVVGSSGELGLVQIKPETAAFVARIYGLQEPSEGWRSLLWDYNLNIEYGALYLKYLLNRTNGNLFKALELYNGGSRKSEYANKIIKAYEEMMTYHQDLGSGR